MTYPTSWRHSILRLKLQGQRVVCNKKTKILKQNQKSFLTDKLLHDR